jgi:hypothetical protein
MENNSENAVEILGPWNDPARFSVEGGKLLGSVAFLPTPDKNPASRERLLAIVSWETNDHHTMKTPSAQFPVEPGFKLG